MAIVKMDEKGRIQLPHEVREEWRLRPKQPLIMEINGDRISLKKARNVDPASDPLLRDILTSPGRSKVKVTRRLLRSLKDEAWSP